MNKLINKQTNKLRIASAQFDLRSATVEQFWARVQKLCQSAADRKARLILFPEYFALSYFAAVSKGKFSQALNVWPSVQKEFFTRFRSMSKEYGLCIVAGTVPVFYQGRRVNRCHIFTKKGQVLTQDKQFMTRFEDEEWKVRKGNTKLTTFKLNGWRIGVAICFDVEFPSYVSALAKKQFDVLLVPSCTEDIHGYWRVRHCAQARAIETQSYVVTSSIVGGNKKYSDISNHFGQSVILTPCDTEFPAGGVLKSGRKNKEALVVADLDYRNIQDVRKNGTVLNRKLLK